MDWSTFAMCSYFSLIQWFYTVPPTWFRLPPDKPTTQDTPAVRRRKILLLALLIGLRKAQSIPHIPHSSDVSLDDQV